MELFGVSRWQKLLSRIYFYITVSAGFWFVGNMLPTSAEVQAESDRRLGVAEAFIGVPVANLPRELQASLEDH